MRARGGERRVHRSRARSRCSTSSSAAGMRVIHQQNRGTSAARMTGVCGHAARRTSSRWTPTTRFFPARWPRWRTRSTRAPARRGVGRADASSARWSEPQRGARPGARSLADHVLQQPALRGLFRRDALLAVGGWSLPGAFQDWDLWMALAEAGYAAAPSRCGRVTATASTAGASSRAAPPATTRSTPSCGAATRACSRNAARTGGARRTPGACASGCRWPRRRPGASAAPSPPAVHAGGRAGGARLRSSSRAPAPAPR